MRVGEKMIANDIKTASQLIEAIRELWDARSISRLREWLEELKTEDDYYRLIRLADQMDLYKYSNLLATHAYKRFGTLRPFAWHCTRLLENGKSLEAEERMGARLQEVADTAYTVEERVSAHTLLFRVFCQLNRLPEAKEQLEKISEAQGVLWPDLEAFYYLHGGEWVKAERVLTDALADDSKEREEYVRLLLADHLSVMGRQEASLDMLVSGQAAYPDNWSFWMEQVKRRFLLGRYEETIDLMEDINSKNPFHVNREYYAYLTAECLYKLEKWDDLDAWIQGHQEVLEKTIYGKTAIQRGANRKQLELTPKLQKLDYCVPASLSIMLEAFGMDIGQDEIATHVFDVTGSKLRTTMQYMESLGLRAQYFKGTVDVYKKMIDAGVPVLLSMMVENNAHVQVVVGYDDRLQTLLIQDPNDQSPFFVPYAEMKDAYKLTDSLSMVFVKEEQMHLLALLDEGEHRFFERLYEFLDEEGEGESEAFIDFLQEHKEQRYAAVVGISILFSDRAKALHAEWVERLRQDLGSEDAELALLTAHMHYQKDEMPDALASLAVVNEKNSPYALFLRGVILMSQDSQERAIPYLKQSIELDHYQPAAYSHLARCYMEVGKLFQAYKWSAIALAQLPSDIYAQITHGLIQYESGAYEKSLERFRKLSAEFPEDGYFVYEIGRCLLALGEEAEAIEHFERYIEMAPERPYAYLRIAEIYMEAEKWEPAMAIVNRGILQAEEKDVLHVYRGHIAMAKEQFAAAETDYRTALELDPEDLFAVTYIAHSLVKQQRFDDAVAFLASYTDQGDTGFFIRSATMLWEEWPEYAGQQQAVALMEKGLEKRELEDYEDIAQQYMEFGEHPLFRNRVLNQFKKMRHAEASAALLCYEGQLHEQAGNSGFARKLYLQALDKAPNAQAHFQLGLLEVEAERFKAGIREFLRSTELDPGNTAVREALMHAYTEAEDFPRAFATALFILQNDPLELEFDELFELARTEEAVAAISKTLEGVSGQVPEEWLFAAKAFCAEKEGKFDEAEALFGQAKAVKGAFPSRYQHVQFCARRGDFKRAVALLEELITERPEDERLYGEYIRILAQLGKAHEINKWLKKRLRGEQLGLAQTFCADELALWFTETEEMEEAEEQPRKGVIGRFFHKAQRLRVISHVFALYDEAAKQIPENELPVMRHGAFCLSRGMAKEAIDELKPFVKRTGHYEAAVMQLQAMAQLAVEKDSLKILEEAIDLAKQLHARQPADALVLTIWAELLGNLERDGEELEKYEQALRLEPFNAETHTLVMQTLAEQRPGDVEAFIAGIPEEVEIPEWIQLARAQSQLTLGNAPAAHAILMPLTQQEKDFQPAIYELALCEMKLGNKGAAIKTLRKLFRKEGSETYVMVIAGEPAFEGIHDEIDELIEELF
ncbi:tetratricopeptide repeat protein [Planococcus sp. APC 3906]|uniref:tetratricopeptide repeat protein n=1 Tax=Planococcus sp. APC 3906 TaxID=3035194 RepID=UPI0025B51DC2|nr:tetratricopeptide repeat protein [Planococcus sp. APC 3906]MDN3450640.1 tetratricopeptide repeat protein [Planococcus sp. APC 3906]